MLSRDIRQSFIDYIAARGHRPVPSSPLVPHGDATLLFTNAGMVQFKDYFLGLALPENRRAVTAQKCLRVSGKHNDLENVGPSPRHHTFFEMLGNFSFGDYFKEAAIEFAWELVTGVWGLDRRTLFATVFREDDEAFELWRRISGLPAERVLRCDEQDNFWAMGDTGPCGPCSEIYVDLRPGEPQVPWSEGTQSGRYLEIWNLVFMQFERASDGSLRALPNPSIDTGAGLERVAAVLSGKASNYDTDLFVPLIQAAAQAAGKRYGAVPRDDVSLRVIADHVRAVAFLLADGVIASNEGRGYVLRRLLRRAVRHGMHLGLEQPFLGELLPVLGSVLGHAYPELRATERASRATIAAEESRFIDTVAIGARHMQQLIEVARGAGRSVVTGRAAFRLYVTYGLPIDTIREIAEEERITIDQREFDAELEHQRERSRSATGEQQALVQQLQHKLREQNLPETTFLGYDQLANEGARVLWLLRAASDGGYHEAAALGPGERGVAVFDRTVFYAEGGGQVGDQGEIEAAGGRTRVLDTQKTAGIFVHTVEVGSGRLVIGEAVAQRVDADRRRSTERHHTATHLLHAALRQQLGESVRQAGSLVHPERLRFDFTFGAALTEEQRTKVEERVNDWVRRANPVEFAVRPYREAVADGAMALFGEKYGDSVRTVSVPGISLELCGGCHVRNTGAIGSLVLVGERGIAAGVRRVEALAGAEADAWRRAQERSLRRIEGELGVSGERAAVESAALKERLRAQERELARLRQEFVLKAEGGSYAISGSSVDLVVSGIKVWLREVEAAPANELRTLADVLRGKLASGVVVLGTRSDDRLSLVTAVTADLTSRVDAGALARRLGDAVGGSGGGRRDFAQAGGKDPKRLEDAFRAVEQAVAEQVAGES